MIVGITGGSGSGKTTLLTMIKEQGGMVLDCDAIYHALLKTDKDMLAAIERHFPGTVEDGCLNRKKLGKLVFADEKALQTLNEITHGAVKREVQNRLKTAPKLAAIDAIGLFEGHLAELCDVTVAVLAPKEVRIRRLVAREHISEEYVEKRIGAQHDDAWFEGRCDYVLQNDGTIGEFREKCLAFFTSRGIMK